MIFEKGLKRASSDSVSNTLEVGQEVLLANPSKHDAAFSAGDCLRNALNSLGCEAEGLAWNTLNLLLCSLCDLVVMIVAWLLRNGDFFMFRFSERWI